MDKNPPNNNSDITSQLIERVKELTCLYNISKLSHEPHSSIESLIEKIVNLIPSAWQYPEIASAKIILDTKTFFSKNYNEKKVSCQQSLIKIKTMTRGLLEVSYSTKKPDSHEGPFLLEERNLLNTIADQLGTIINNKEIEDEKSKLLSQLRHADRIATIGQLSAGVAHEINEPLGNILGFAEILKKQKNLSVFSQDIIEEIISASLYAREIIKKLLLFARQAPLTSDNMIDINNMILEDLEFLKMRCKKENIKISYFLNEKTPKVLMDKSHLKQVLINLIVNALQAMPSGGKLTFNTDYDDQNVFISVTDSGIGIKKELLNKIFEPFFTTKDVTEGTGLGLSVVHGIITSCEGTISVKSKPGEGTTFKIKLPIKNTNKEV